MGGPANTLTLRPLRISDAEVISRWGSDPGFCRAAGWTVDLPLAELRHFHHMLIESPSPDLIRLAAIRDEVLVGYVDLCGSDPHRRELGFVIGERRQWGRGFGYQAAAAGVAHGFDRLGLRVIWAEALDANQRSVRILQRLGLTETGSGEDGVFLDQPTYYRRFAITASDWRRAQPC